MIKVLQNVDWLAPLEDVTRDELILEAIMRSLKPQTRNTPALIRNAARMVYPTNTLKISKDESDNRFYECAEAAAPDYLITGNTQDFSEDHAPTIIIRPRDFIDRIVPTLL